MSEALASAVAIAASPFPIIPAVLLLFTPRPLPTGFSFLAGWSTGIGASATAFAMLAEVVDRSGTTPTWASWARITLGAALVVIGARGWLKRGETTEPPEWIGSIQSSTPRRALRLGLLLSAANPKVLLLAAAGGLAVGSADLTTSEVIASLVLFTVVAAATVTAPPLLYLTAGQRVLQPLGRVKDWLLLNSAAVMAVVIAAIGIALLLKGAASL